MSYLKYALAFAAGALTAAAYSIWTRRESQQVILMTEGDAQDVVVKYTKEKKKIPNGLHQAADGSIFVAMDGPDYVEHGFPSVLFGGPATMNGIGMVGPFKSEAEMERFINKLFKDLENGFDDEDDDD